MESRPIAALDALLRHERRPEDIEELWHGAVAVLRRLFAKILVLDDDPTGSQTVHGIPVYTGWTMDDLRSARREDSHTVYVLTNSRSLNGIESEALHRRLMANWIAAGRELAAGESAGGMPDGSAGGASGDSGPNGSAGGASGDSGPGRGAPAGGANGVAGGSSGDGRPGFPDGDTLVISRSDSTLRGHYPVEPRVLREALPGTIDGEILVPFFPEGGRFTFGDVHYVRDGDRLVPAGDTEFARDSSFAFAASNLRDYVEEKTGGAVRAADVVSISLEALRRNALEPVVNALVQAPQDARIIVNAVDYADLKVFAAALAASMEAGRRFVLRSAASLVKVLAGLEDRPPLEASDLFADGRADGPGLLVAGSYVGKTTRQLAALMEAGILSEVSINIREALVAEGFPAEVNRARRAAEVHLAAGRGVALFTSNAGRRDFLRAEEGEEDLSDLELSARISTGLVDLVAGLETPPAWVLTKGGITSHDIASKALGLRRAMVLGQILPGIPVWRCGDESRWPGVPLVIFPGNVGDDKALSRAVDILVGRR